MKRTGRRFADRADREVDSGAHACRRKGEVAFAGPGRVNVELAETVAPVIQVEDVESGTVPNHCGRVLVVR